jgi:4-alpha-glucanotransferase
VRRLVLAVHDASFPADPGEDTGRGSPYTGAGRRFLRFASSLGFDGVQLGPQGCTTRDNPSPYDGALFAKDPLSIALAPLVDDPAWGRLLAASTLEAIAAGTPASGASRVRHRYAFDARRRALRDAYRELRRRTDLPPRARALALPLSPEEAWLERDLLFTALAAEHGGDDWRTWPEAGPARLDRRLSAPRPGEEAACARRAAFLLARHAGEVGFDVFCQRLLADQHRELRQEAGKAGLLLWGDFQVGLSHRDCWSWQSLLLSAYRMGAPPSRTNPAGQPWGFPVLDPDRYGSHGAPGPALAFVAARADRAFAEYDGLRVDHPHGLICPWVYDADAADPARAVTAGARLLSSPDLADHPGLARFAIAEPGQLDRTVPRHADSWVKELRPEQVDRYAVVLSLILERAARHGRSTSDVACEVLSTWPFPVRQAMSRFGLGRFLVVQKADPIAEDDPYRSAGAAPEDWIMAGTHDTPPVWEVARSWGPDRATAWAGYLASRLEPSPVARPRLAEELAGDRLRLVEALLADLFVGPARQVSVFFTDLLGLREAYNVPGTVGEANWTLRVPADFEAFHRQRLARGAALNVPRAVARALQARFGPHAGARIAELIGRLEREARRLAELR